MTLNEAIRKGIRLYPIQEFQGDDNDDGKGACVLGALAAGMGYPKQNWVQASREMGLREQNKWTQCPTSHCTGMRFEDTLHAMAYHLNDYHKWSREAIAEWLDPHPELHQPMPKESEAVVTQGERTYAIC